MKILYVNSPEWDYMQDLLYSGFVKVCGAENVYDFPMHKRYHWIDKKYPKNLGLNRGWHSLQRLFSPFPKDIDAVVVGSSKHHALKNYMSLLAKIPKSVPVVLIDGGDQPAIGGDLIYYKSPYVLENVEKVRPFDFIFKREFLPEYLKNPRIIPLPFCMNMDRIPKPLPSQKKYDVSFWAVESDPIRTKALTLLENQFDCRQNGTTRNQKFHLYKRKGRFYLEELARCKIVLHFRGGGWDTMRYWEVPAVGSLMITPNPGIVIPNDFQDGRHVVHCKDDLSDLIDKCDYYLKNDQLRETIAQAGHLHLLTYHQDIHRAQVVIDTLTKFNL